MSSLLDKLRTLISSNVRGPRRYRKESSPPAEPQESSRAPEVTEAPARKQKVPEVTEAPEAYEAPSQVAATTRQQVSRVEEPRKEEDETEALEEERIVDLLKGEQS